MMRRNLVLICLALAGSAFAANPPAPNSATAAVVAPLDADSRQTREEMKALLRRYPPQLGMVLRLDPTLFSNETYLAHYPGLASFVAQHPEIAHNAAYFLDDVPVPGGDDAPSMRAWRVIMGDVGGFVVFVIFTWVLVWVIKTLIEQRRWTQLSKAQTEVQNKLLDRFSSNEELLAYIQTPAGKRFFESAPMPLEAGPRPIGAPFDRILWSLQVGLVTIAAGIGFYLVSARVRPPAAEGLYGIGVIAFLVGIALVVSAVVFYILSKRFGLWQPPAPSES